MVNRLSQARGQLAAGQEGPFPIDSSADILTSADWEWTAPENLGPIINTPSVEGGPTLSRDGLTLVFHSNREGGLGNMDLWCATRPSLSEVWNKPVNLGPEVNSTSTELDAGLSGDGLTLVFNSNRPGGQGALDVWMCTRADPSQPWSAALNLTTVNSEESDFAPALSADGLHLLFHTYRAGNQGAGDLWICTRPSKSAPWSAPKNLGPRINSPAFQGFAALADDGLALIFNSTRGGGPWAGPLRISTRTSPQGEWAEPRRLWDDTLGAWSACLSADAQAMLFDTKRPGGQGGFDLWMTRRVRKPPRNAAAFSLDGRWVLVAGEYQTRPVPAHEARDTYPTEMLIKGDQYGLTWWGKPHEGSLRIDPSKTPAEIDFTGSVFAGLAPRKAIYELDGDCLMLCMAFVGPNADPPRPASFRTDPDSKNVVLTYRREATAGPDGVYRVIKRFGDADWPLDRSRTRWSSSTLTIDIAAKETVRLFRVEKPGTVERGVWAFRGQIKTGEFQGDYDLHVGGDWEDDAGNKAGDGSLNVFPKEEWQKWIVNPNTSTGIRPAIVELYVHNQSEQAGTVWLKDIELVEIDPNWSSHEARPNGP